MSVLKNISRFFYTRSLKKDLKKSSYISREMMNISQAKTIGVLYNATKPEDVMVVSQFAEKLKAEEKQVYILGFQNVKSKESSSEKIINRNDLSWSEIPNEEKIAEFQKIDLDILICAFKEECLPLEYIAACSKAKFRVGAFSQSKTNFYELMINIKPEQKLFELLQQIIHFLKVINKNEQ